MTDPITPERRAEILAHAERYRWRAYPGLALMAQHIGELFDEIDRLSGDSLAASLADTAKHLDEHIERRAQEIAEPQILAAQLAAKTQLDRQARDHAFEQQRKDDLVAELRRQLEHAGRSVDRLSEEAKKSRAAVRNVETLHVWTNEDGKRFVFAEELWAALAEVSTYGPAALLAATPLSGADR
jgi:hypothetical protein